MDELVIADRIAEAADHRRDLRVEDRMRDQPAAMVDDLDVLPGGMEHLEHLLIRHQLEERLEVDALGQRVDHDRFLGACHLNDAEQGIVGGLTQEFRIDGDDWMSGETGAGCGEFRSGCNQIHERSITRPTGVRPKVLACQGSRVEFGPCIWT